ncbi:MAG: hypothetical protein LBP76_07640 [Treponema sp.]|nr:hypothetical protein [Treponema sp.]
MNEENKEKGERAEKLFEHYLNSVTIPFYRIDQNKESQSEEFRNKHIRRPDYLIHTKKGVFHVDVKYRKKTPFGKNKEERFPIGSDNIDSLFQFQEQFYQEVWLAFTNNLNDPQFYYITISIINEYYINIQKIYAEKKYKIPEEILIYIPDSLLLFDKLSFEKGFYKEPNLANIEEDVECLNRIAHYTDNKKEA